jgi:hypothetical protein
VDGDVEEQPGREVEGAREAIAFSDEPYEEWFIASLPTQPAGPESRRIRHPESVVAPRGFPTTNVRALRPLDRAGRA